MTLGITGASSRPEAADPTLPTILSSDLVSSHFNSLIMVIQWFPMTLFVVSLKIYAQDPVEALRYTRVELNCTIRGPPGITYRTKWYKGHELQETVIGYKPLVIENVTQGGEYTCRVEEVTNNSNDDEESFELVIVGKSVGRNHLV